MSNCKLSVIIVSYNSKKNLERCVKSVYARFKDQFSWEIIVVNNDKKENLSDLEIDFSKVQFIEHKKNIGFGAGMNLGYQKARGKFLLLLNPDAEIISDNVADLLKEFAKDEKVGIIGAGIINKKGEKQEWSAGKEISLYDLIRNNLKISRSKKIWNSSCRIDCDWTSGTALFIRKKLFGRLQGFDDRFFMYFEDVDLCRRARELGAKIIFYPEFEVYHKNGDSYESNDLQKKHYYNSMENFFIKHSNYFCLWILKIIRKYIFKK